MRRIVAVFLVATALVATIASSALAATFPCVMGCFGANTIYETDLR